MNESCLFWEVLLIDFNGLCINHNKHSWFKVILDGVYYKFRLKKIFPLHDLCVFSVNIFFNSHLCLHKSILSTQNSCIAVFMLCCTSCSPLPFVSYAAKVSRLGKLPCFRNKIKQNKTKKQYTKLPLASPPKILTFGDIDYSPMYCTLPPPGGNVVSWVK